MKIIADLNQIKKIIKVIGTDNQQGNYQKGKGDHPRRLGALSHKLF